MPYKDREKQLEAQRRAYHKKKEYFLAKQKIRRIERRQWFNDNILANAKCIKCGEDHPACIDFHHVDPLKKTQSISKMVKYCKPEADILAEIKKCEILCSNCHRKHHYNERLSGDPDGIRTRDAEV